MKTVPEFGTLFGDLLDGIFEAIASFFGTVLAAIGELFVSTCEAVTGSDNLVIVVPSGFAGAVVVGSGIRMVTGGGADALVSTTTLVVIAVLFVLFLVAILLASSRRRRRQ